MAKKPKKKKKSKNFEPQRRGHLSEEEIIQIAELRGNEPHFSAGDVAVAFGVSIPTVYKYASRIIAFMTPWEKIELLENAKKCGISPSSFVALLNQEYGKYLINKIKKGGLRAVS